MNCLLIFIIIQNDLTKLSFIFIVVYALGNNEKMHVFVKLNTFA
jgi:hypothetical protein